LRRSWTSGERARAKRCYKPSRRTNMAAAKKAVAG
jgi:hypothetical protein